VVRWELRTRPFLRTTEFLWQEGHTAHGTEAEAEQETLQMLDIYADFAINEAAIPVVKGRKSEIEKFAGALRTYTIEAMMRDTRALQSGTSHNLGQNFAKAFNIKYLSRQNVEEFCWTTSWGVSTRMVGAIVMAHGDDKGLRLPPRVAPIQVVAVPVYKNDVEHARVMETVDRLVKELRGAGLRVHVDTREDSPGFKFNDWEMRGVPVRLEVGPKDVDQNQCVLARRDKPGKEGKQFIPQEGLAARVRDLLDDVHHNLLRQATEFRESNTHDITTYAQLGEIVERGGWVRGWWAGSNEDEKRVKEETGATLRCFPLDQPGGNGTCFLTDQPASQMAIFARAY
jgi:prolyl-tRNA synthetase